MVAALLVLSRFFLENLAAQGYLDISYVALIVWAVVLEVERPRRGTAVLALLAAAGLLRPDAWVLAGVYWLWCCVAQRTTALDWSTWRSRRSAPLIWVLVDLIVTGKPFYSLNSTAGLAQELGRTQGLGSVIGSLWTFTVRIDKLPAAARRAGRHSAGDLADAAARAHAAGRAGAAVRACSCSRAPPARR